jgi:mannose-6-phosphate isomerase-like protein (cupin superfamily)
MKQILCAIVAALLPGFALADVYVIGDDAAGVPQVEILAAPALSDVPEIGGMANQGFSYAQLWGGMDGFKVFEGRIAPGGKIVSHEGPDTYIGYIVSGHGTLGNDAPDGTMASSIEFGPGDVIAFGPGTLHHWVNGDEELVFVGFQKLNGAAEN